MHYHLEIIMPPTADVHADVTEILAPFDENGDDENCNARHGFWDFWTIGGRWSGEKLMAMLGADREQAFRNTLADRGVTVSGFQSGKPTLKPQGQRTMVNALWHEAFPDAPIQECPLFDCYKGDAGDIMLLRDMPKAMECEHVIIAGPDYTGMMLCAQHMLRKSMWNGVSHQKSSWDGTVGSALLEWGEQLASYKAEYAERVCPVSEWVSVTVDYHS